MFERILVQQHRPDPTDEPLDLGALVEAMVFYGRTDLILTPGVLSQMGRAWGVDGVLELIAEEHLGLLHSPESHVVFTESLSDGREFHRPDTMTVHDKPGQPPAGLERYVPRVVEELLGRGGKARRFAHRLSISAEALPVDPQAVVRARLDMLNNDYTNAVVADLVALLAPGYEQAAPISFIASEERRGLAVSTNLDFAALNTHYHRLVSPTHSTLTPSYLLANILSARGALDTAALLGAELTLDPRHAVAAIRRTDMLFGSPGSSAAHLKAFQEFTLHSASSIREAVNSGERDIRDILTLLAHARKFRKWVGAHKDTPDLLRSCYADSVATTWAERLPSKTARWFMFTGAGLALDAVATGGLGLIAGLATSAADGFLLDRLIAGWKPSQFIEDRLKPFVRSDAV